MKRRVIIPSERGVFERLNFSSIFQYAGPAMFLLAAGIALVLSQWAVLNSRGDSFRVGSPAPETYRVITPMRYDDRESASKLRAMAGESVAGVNVRDVTAKSRLMRRLEALGKLQDVQSAKTSEYLSRFPERFLSAFLMLKTEDRMRILNSSYTTGCAFLDRLEKDKIRTPDSSAINSILWEEILAKRENIPDNDANFVYQILAVFGNLNIRHDEWLTALARQAVMNEVPIIDRKFDPGDVIVSEGETVTEQTAILLRLQGYTEDVFPFSEIFSVILCVLLLPLWFDILCRGAGEHKPTQWCVVFIVITAWICETIAAKLGIYGAGTLAASCASFLCIQDYLAFCIAVTASASGSFIVTGQAVTNVILMSALSVFTAMACFYVMRNFDSARQASYRMVLMAFILTALRMSLRYMQGTPYSWASFSRGALLFFLYEVVSSNVIMGALQYFEEYIGTISIMTIRDISNPSSPLLRDLQRQAPGTYQHSLTIATLIEAVGMELGMDTNLLRAGAYYHDIGKMRHPEYFVENQGGGENIHDTKTPTLSSMAIIAHVKDGLELAWEAKLPKRIRDFIAEHHGDTSTRYFYNKAVASGQKVEWQQFCYPGPKPQSRETALLMITDSVEAAVRAANIREIEAEESGSQAVSKIEKIVTQVIQSKINENQFENAALTMKDFTVIKRTLVSVLQSMYHTRKVKQIERRK